MNWIRAQFEGSASAFRALRGNRPLRRLQSAYAISDVASWGAMVAISSYAFAADGAAAVGALLVIRFVPSAIAAPILATFADRYDKRTVLGLSDAARVVFSLAIAGVMLASGSYWIVFGISALSGIAGSVFPPAKQALQPSLVRTPEELTAANVVGSLIESLSILVGPAIGGVILAASSPQVVFLVTAAGLSLSAALVLLTRTPPAETEETVEEAPAGGILAQTRLGFAAVLGDPSLRLLIGLLSAQVFMDGALGVLTAAIAFDALDIGDTGLGLLMTFCGVGGLLGAGVAGGLAGRRHLAMPFALGCVLWGLPIAALAAVGAPAAAYGLMAVIGIANTLVDVSGFTLLQRIAPEEVLARVFGVLESLMLLAVAAGGALASVLTEAAGIDTALIVAGSTLPVLVVLTWVPLRRIDAATAPPPGVPLLEAVPMFSALSPLVLERLAGRLEPVTVPAGQEIIRQGETGDRFYVIADGRVEVLVDGRAVREEGAGEWFGEIALIERTPRTATVRALTDVELRALPGEEFVSAVSGEPESLSHAGAIVADRLAHAAPIARAT